MQKVREKDYTLPIKGLSAGKHRFDFAIDGLMFADSESTRITDACLIAVADVEKSATWIKITCNIKGTVSAECDRCLEEVKLPIDTDAKLLVKFVRTEEETDDDEVLILEPNESELDLKQFFYDYVCLSLPIKIVHDENDCNPEVLEKLNLTAKKAKTTKKESEKENPFSKLKDLLN